MSIAVIYGGTRQNGNTEILTEQAIRGITTEKIYLRDYQIQPIEDLRHAEGGFREVDDEYNSIIDRWSQTLRDIKYPGFKHTMANKKAYVIAVGEINRT